LVPSISHVPIALTDLAAAGLLADNDFGALAISRACDAAFSAELSMMPRPSSTSSTLG
jgi:hypothetical protein